MDRVENVSEYLASWRRKRNDQKSADGVRAQDTRDRFRMVRRRTGARGWTVINSLRGDAAGGGTRMRAGLDRREVESLAKTMEGSLRCPAADRRRQVGDRLRSGRSAPRDEVLKRWFRAVAPLLKNYYGTGGDLNVDELADVIPITESYGLWHPQEGVVVGHFQPKISEQIQKVGQLRVVWRRSSRMCATPRHRLASTRSPT